MWGCMALVLSIRMYYHFSHKTETEMEMEMEMEMEIGNGIGNGIGNWKWSSNIHATTRSYTQEYQHYMYRILRSSLVLRHFQYFNVR